MNTIEREREEIVKSKFCVCFFFSSSHRIRKQRKKKESIGANFYRQFTLKVLFHKNEEEKEEKYMYICICRFDSLLKEEQLTITYHHTRR